MMKRMLALAVAMVLLLGLSACADEMDPYLGTWEGENVVVEIYREDGEVKCRALFGDWNVDCDIWEIDNCWYDEEEDAMTSGNVIKTRGWFDILTDEFVEEDWSISDLYFNTFTFNGSRDALIWTDETMEKSIELTRRKN